MLDAGPRRRQPAADFASLYENQCALQDSAPLAGLRACLREGELEVLADRLRLADWTPLLRALQAARDLQSIAVRSCFQPRPGETGR